MPLLPEFDFIGFDTIPSPVYGTRRFAIRIPHDSFRIGGFQFRARGDDAALPGRDGREPAAHGPGGKIRIRFPGGKLHNAARNANLAIQFPPVKHQRRPPVHVQLRGFAAFVVGKKDEAALVDSLKQNHPDRWLAASGRGGQRHGVRFGDSSADGDAKPALELVDGIGVEVFLSKPLGCQLPVYEYLRGAAKLWRTPAARPRSPSGERLCVENDE